MSRLFKLVLIGLAAVAVVALASACGTEKISVPTAQTQLHTGAVLFSERCSGCHTLSYAATHGSAANVRTAQYNNGPNFNVRCERPVARVMYAIANGGFSGAIMPQNIVVGADARAVAQFISTYAGRQAPRIPGVVPCESQPVGTIPSAAQFASLQKSSQAAGAPGGATQQSAAGGSPGVRAPATSNPAAKKPGQNSAVNRASHQSQPNGNP